MDAASEISAAVTAIHRTAYGQQLSSIETVVGAGCVACVLRFKVTRAEHAVIQAGDGATVSRLYDATELSLEPSLRAAVERTTGRSVLAFQASMNPEHGLILEAFVLVPLS
jgi:uncharacterized protein YbcI